jgi:hypothetical protein
MSNIQQAIQHAASRFASEVVSILRGATLSDIVALTGKNAEHAAAIAAGANRGGRRGRRAGDSASAGRGVHRRGRRAGRKRSREEVQKLAERVVDFLKGNKQEIGVSGIAEALKVTTADLGLPLSRLRQEGKLKTHGQKRSTVYRLG